MDNRYRINRAARSLLTANLGLIAAAVFLLSAFVPLVRFFGHNVAVNLPILGVFAIGILLVYMNLLRLSREERLANLVYRRCFVDKVDGWGKDNLLDRLPRSAVRTRIAQVRELGLRGGPAHEEALGEIAAAEESAKAAAVRYLVGILVFLGLIGTFAGLLLTVDGVRGIIGAMEFDPYADMGVSLRQLREDLSIPLQGMSTAFSTSLFGLGASVILGFLGLQLTRGQEYFLAKMNDLTVIYLFSAYHVGERRAARVEGGTLAQTATPSSVAEAESSLAGGGRAWESGARYLEAGARALHKDVESLTDAVRRSQESQQSATDSLQQIGNLLRQSAESLARLEAGQRERDAQGSGAVQIEAAVRDLEGKVSEMLGSLEKAAERGGESSRSFQEKLERESRTMANHLTSGMGDLADLWDAAAREICLRISEGNDRIEGAIQSLARAMQHGAGDSAGSGHLAPRPDDRTAPKDERP